MINQIEIRPASEVNRGDLIEALNHAYADYFIPIHMGQRSFERLVKRESIKMNYSRAALVGGQVIGLGLLAVRDHRGWIGGMGVLPEYRRQGIGRGIMQNLIRQARQLNLKTLQLEVITRNEAAYELYNSLNFEIVRDLLVMVSDDATDPDEPGADALMFNVLQEVPEALLPRLPDLAAVDPPWQYDPVALRVIAPRMQALAIRQQPDGRIRGLCLYTIGGHSGSVLALAAENQQAGRALLDELFTLYPVTNFTYLYVSEHDPMLPVLRAAGFKESLRQHEMTLNLNKESLT